ncbi:MAG TPA: universal stress protein [Thermoanaerobaculia bacterium]|nr:universal stress protein [Thermoanaerobaculia bacterium]
MLAGLDRNPALASTIRTVLIGTSLSDASDEVVLNGLRLARAAGAKIQLVHAFDLTMLYSGATFGGGAYLPEMIDAERHGWRQRLQEQAVRVGIESGELAGVQPLEGAPHRVLVAAAEEAGADLIVVGAAESWGSLSKLLGSTADRVIRAATCPVVATRGELVVPPRRVVIAVDLSPAAGDAMRCGLRVLAAIGGGPGGHPHTAVEALLVTAAGQEIERRAEDSLKSFVDSHSPDPGWHVTGRVRGGAVAHAEILARCRDAVPDLIVLGTHGRGGFERFLIGSVSESVLRHAQGSLLVIPPRAAAIAPRAT